MSCLLKKKKKKEKEKNFQKNGSLLLEELIASSGGEYNPISTFSSRQILQATNHFDWNYVIYEDRFVWYRGTIENRAVLIKNYKGEPFTFQPDNFYRDIAVSSMMSSHKNVLKLLGCCLEFPRPVLVCEYPEKGALLTFRGREGERIKPLPWNVRLKIAKEVADAVTFLHTRFPRTIIHRDLKPSYIFLDKNWTAKLSSFSLSIPIPEGESGVNDIICGTTGHVEHQYRTTGKSGYNHCREYAGKCLGRGSFTKLIDPSMLNSSDKDIPDHSRVQMEAFFELALRCVGFRPGENKPHMIDVAKELENIEKQT